jgi:hypothetical protein
MRLGKALRPTCVDQDQVELEMAIAVITSLAAKCVIEISPGQRLIPSPAW